MPRPSFDPARRPFLAEYGGQIGLGGILILGQTRGALLGCRLARARGCFQPVGRGKNPEGRPASSTAKTRARQGTWKSLCPGQGEVQRLSGARQRRMTKQTQSRRTPVESSADYRSTNGRAAGSERAVGWCSLTVAAPADGNRSFGSRAREQAVRARIPFGFLTEEASSQPLASPSRAGDCVGPPDGHGFRLEAIRSPSDEGTSPTGHSEGDRKDRHSHWGTEEKIRNKPNF